MRELRVLLLSVSVTAAACGGDDEADTTAADAARIAADSAAAASLLTPIRAVSVAEVEYADMASQRTADPDLRQYAQTVAADHRALIVALDSVAAVHRATLADTPETQELSNTVRLAHSGLDDLQGAGFDLPFVRAEVESHRLLLDQLDQQLIPSASQSDLRTLLTDIRAMADAHLTRARQLLAQQLGQAEEPPQPDRQRPVQAEPQRPAPPPPPPPPDQPGPPQ
jgi:putative membrane protein